MDGNDIMPMGEQQDDNINVQAWLNKINKARNKESKWRDRAKKCVKIYRGDAEDCDNTFNILWANTETLLPALFSAVPKPDVRNRYLNQDKVASQAGQVLERCLSYSLDLYNFARLAKACIKDYALTGRGLVRVRLLPKFEQQTQQMPEPVLDEMGNPVLNEDGTPMVNMVEFTEEVMTSQSVRCELVPWDSITIDPVKRWEDVKWISFRHPLTKEEFEEYFPGEPLVAASKENDRYATEEYYQVEEIWDKSKKRVLFLGQADKPLKVLDDPLKLENFWPIPEPLYSIQTNDTLVPIPEYTVYQELAHELNIITYRISDLINSCKLIGVYDAMETALSDMLQAQDSKLVAVASNLLKNGGIKTVIDFLDISPLSAILRELYAQREQIKSTIFEVTGISDIIRGESKASETATAQNIKARYAGLRLRDRRDNINRFVVDLLRMKAELIATFFTPQQMQEMSGIEITPDIENLIRSDVLRNYKIDIETDSTILADMEDEAQKRAALVASITQFIGTVSPLVAQGALPMETAKALLMFALQSTKITRELEDALELIGTAPPPMAPPSLPMPMGTPQNATAAMPIQAPLPQQGQMMPEMVQ